jgi:restriction system protein
MSMDTYDAREYILEELQNVDPEQLEYLCMAVMMAAEDPDEIEVTPFVQDGGIDIHGVTGQIFYNGEFGVQIKQSKNKIGSDNIQTFVGSLKIHGYHFGSFITTSEFTKPAHTDVDDTDNFSVQLISGSSLAEIMLEQEQGVTLQSEEEDTYVKNLDFWSQFEVDEDLISSSLVPQADDLEVLTHTILAVHSGHKFKPEIADYLIEKTTEGWTRRQADYYALAAYSIGLLEKDEGEYEEDGITRQIRKWRLSPAGEEYVELVKNESDDADSYLYDQIREMEIMTLVVDKIKQETQIVQSDIADVIRKESTVSGSTADRRAKTLGNWLGAIDGPIVRNTNTTPTTYAHQRRLSDFS